MTNNWMGSAPIKILLAPGAWHGGWVWEKVQLALSKEGIPNEAISFPGPGRAPGDFSFSGHCQYLRKKIDEAKGP